MTDIALEIMISAPIPPAGREAFTYRPGHVVATYPASRIAKRVGQNYRARGGVGMPRTGYVFVTGIPDSIDSQKFHRVMTDAYRVWAIPAVAPIRRKKRRRLRRIRFSLMSQAMRDKLQNDREITITFTQLKAMMRRLTVVDDNDHRTDIEVVALSDSDFP